jgi:hypothetical protein
VAARRGMPLVASCPMHSARDAAGRALQMVLSTCRHMLQRLDLFVQARRHQKTRAAGLACATAQQDAHTWPLNRLFKPQCMSLIGPAPQLGLLGNTHGQTCL